MKRLIRSALSNLHLSQVQGLKYNELVGIVNILEVPYLDVLPCLHLDSPSSHSCMKTSNLPIISWHLEQSLQQQLLPQHPRLPWSLSSPLHAVRSWAADRSSAWHRFMCCASSFVFVDCQQTSEIHLPGSEPDSRTELLCALLGASPGTRGDVSSLGLTVSHHPYGFSSSLGVLFPAGNGRTGRDVMA